MNLDKIIGIIRTLNEEGAIANVTGSGGLGFDPETESPPVRKKKKERKYMKGPGRKVWMDYLNGK